MLHETESGYRERDIEKSEEEEIKESNRNHKRPLPDQTAVTRKNGLMKRYCCQSNLGVR